MSDFILYSGSRRQGPQMEGHFVCKVNFGRNKMDLVLAQVTGCADVRSAKCNDKTAYFSTRNHSTWSRWAWSHLFDAWVTLTIWGGWKGLLSNFKGSKWVSSQTLRIVSHYTRYTNQFSIAKNQFFLVTHRPKKPKWFDSCSGKSELTQHYSRVIWQGKLAPPFAMLTSFHLAEYGLWAINFFRLPR